MTFRLIWLDRALRELTAAYVAALEAGLGDTFATAAARVDRELASHPATVGESRAEHERVMFEPPLTVYFEVHEDERVVVVTSVWYLAR